MKYQYLFDNNKYLIYLFALVSEVCLTISMKALIQVCATIFMFYGYAAVF